MASLVKYYLILLGILYCLSTNAQEKNHILKVHFLYGSKPKKEFKHEEGKYFGGLHGGHVTIEIDNRDFGFGPSGKLHVFAHRNNFHGAFGVAQTHGEPPYPEGDKFVTFYIPIEQWQYDTLIRIIQRYLDNTPYDYAFFGMRCAAATNDLLAKIGILKKRSKFGYTFCSFYPKKLRKKLFKLSFKKGYHAEKQNGRLQRKWEKDRYFK